MKALNQGCKKAQFFVTEVDKLYRRERLYKEKGLSAERVKEMRNDSYTQRIIDRMKERMEKLLAEGENQVSDLMWRALNYLHDFWDNLFATARMASMPSAIVRRSKPSGPRLCTCFQ